MSASLCYFFRVLLPLFQRLSLFKRRNVSDPSIVGMGGNEKQMLDAYAGSVSSFWHTNTAQNMSRSGWEQRESGRDKVKLKCVCVCENTKTQECGRLNASETLFKGMLTNTLRAWWMW